MKTILHAIGIEPQHIRNTSEQEFNAIGGPSKFLEGFNARRTRDFAQYCGVFEGDGGIVTVRIFDTVDHAYAHQRKTQELLLIDNQP